MSAWQIVGAIIALGVLIIVHEGGHYFVARWCKMRVERFSLGFGPALVKWKRGETQFQLAPIPLGGFVQITGMNPHEEFDANDPRVYPNRPTWQRFLTIFAGPFTNLLFSIVLIFIVFATAGMSSARFTVGDAPDDKSAPGKSTAAGLLLAGDRIVAIDGEPIYWTRPTALTDRLQETGAKPVDVTVLRDGREMAVRIIPEKDEKGIYRLGIWLGQPYIERTEVGLGTAAVESLKYPWVKSAEMLSNLWDVARRKAPADAAGPVKITRMIGDSMRHGPIVTLEFLAFLNVALGLFNLLPIPALDGGRLVFLGYELVTRRRPNPRIEAAVHMVGFVVLALLIVVITFRDIKGISGAERPGRASAASCRRRSGCAAVCPPPARA